ncbi:MAG: zinc metallopeptidase [Nodosilinea sp. LVE1205-7]
MVFDPIYLVFIIPGMAFMFLAQARIKGTYNRYSQIRSSLGMTGAQVAEAILTKKGIHQIRVEPIAGELTDHYDPGAKTVRLSQTIYDSSSLAAAAVAAHECGHVLQDVQGYQLMNLRAALVPTVNLGSRIGPFMIMIGLALNWLNLAWIGILLFSTVLLFHVVTLPVEFDASSRALRLVDELGILQGEEHKGARAVLNAAALTYVATAFYGLLNVLYYITLISRRR